ncbi:beta-ketoacyl-[acyl-carrier-protein] synthase family protein [Thermodesulfobacteriota bacterium]
MRQCVITGIGIISPLGVGREVFWEGLMDAGSGIRRITAFETGHLASNVAGLVEDFDPSDFMPVRTYRRMSRISRMAVAASLEAVEDSGLNLDDIGREKIAIIMGTAYGASSYVNDFYNSLLRDGPRGAQPLYFPETVPNAPASHVAMIHGINGPNSTFCQNEISAENAILYAKNLIELGRCDAVLVGGGDEISSVQYECYSAVRALQKIKAGEGEKSIRVRGSGLVMGEGACVLVMEGKDYAVNRGAGIYGSLKSCAITGGATQIGHYDSAGKEMKRAVLIASETAGMDLKEIDQIDVSSNFSGELDQMECDQLKSLFPDRMPGMRVTPLKYLTGDFGGAGTLRAAGILLSLKRQMSLPSINIDGLGGRHGDSPAWNHSSSCELKSTLMTSSTFGGGHAALIFGEATT